MVMYKSVLQMRIWCVIFEQSKVEIFVSTDL
jgi:hypothetical protein